MKTQNATTPKDEEEKKTKLPFFPSPPQRGAVPKKWAEDIVL